MKKFLSVFGLLFAIAYLFVSCSVESADNKSNDSPTQETPESVETAEKGLESLTIESEPQKTVYFMGDSVDLTGLVVKAKYTDGSTKTLAATDYDYSPKKLHETGKKTITINYQQKNATFNVEVFPQQLAELALETIPSKTKYNLGDTVDTTGTKLLATYSDGTYKTIDTGFTVFPETLDSVGNQLVTLSYGGKTVTYIVEVIKALNFSLDVTIRDFTDIEGLLTYDENAKTFIAKDDFKYYAWWIDNKKITNSNGFCKITQSLVSDRLNHTIMVIVTDDKGNRYSATAEFSIQ